MIDMKFIIALALLVSINTQPAWSQDGNLPMMGEEMEPEAPDQAPLRPRFGIDGKPLPETKKDDAPEDVDVTDCDPKLLNEFYQHLIADLCKKSAASHCPMTLANLFKNPEKLYQIMGVAGIFAGAFGMDAMMSQGQATQNLRTKIDTDPKLKADPDVLRFRNELDKVTSDKELKKLLGRQSAVRGSEAYRGFIKAAEEAAAVASRSAFRRMALLLVGGGIMFLPELLFSADETACAEYGDPFIEMSSDCRPTFKAGKSVYRFLNLDRKQQLDMLAKNKKLCDYYGKFNERLKKQIAPARNLTNIRCDEEQGPSYTVKLPGGERRITLRQDDEGQLTSVHVRNPKIRRTTHRDLKEWEIKIAKGPHGSTIENVQWQTAFGTPRIASWQAKQYSTKPRMKEFSRVVNVHKFYSRLVQACCQVDDEGQRKKCVNALEDPVEQSLDAQEGEVWKNFEDAPDNGISI